jgi:hypothetical protein
VMPVQNLSTVKFTQLSPPKSLAGVQWEYRSENRRIDSMQTLVVGELTKARSRDSQMTNEAVNSITQSNAHSVP